MEFQKLFRLTAQMDVTYISGALRVSITHEFQFFRLVLDSFGLLWIIWLEMSSWNRSAPLSKLLAAFFLLAAIGDVLYQLTGSEIIEFSPDGLKAGQKLLAWEWVRNYPINKCSELSWRPDENRKGECALECKVGWRKIRFGKFLSEQQAWEVLSQLQQYLPHVAQKMGMTPGGEKSSITRLGLG